MGEYTVAIFCHFFTKSSNLIAIESWRVPPSRAAGKDLKHTLTSQLDRAVYALVDTACDRDVDSNVVADL